jgi:hypothetical protein
MGQPIAGSNPALSAIRPRRGGSIRPCARRSPSSRPARQRPARQRPRFLARTIHDRARWVRVTRRWDGRQSRHRFERNRRLTVRHARSAIVLGADVRARVRHPRSHVVPDAAARPLDVVHDPWSCVAHPRPRRGRSTIPVRTWWAVATANGETTGPRPSPPPARRPPDGPAGAPCYHPGGRARRGTSGALYLQSAPAGLNSLPRSVLSKADDVRDVEDRVPRSGDS